MKRFNYRFQRLLELKERQEETRRVALGQATAVMQRERMRLQELEETRLEHRRMASAAGIAGLRMRADYDLRLRREIGEQTQRLAQAAAVAAEKQQHLVEATRQRRTYEVLRQRAAEEYRKEARRRERIEMDEISERQQWRLRLAAEKAALAADGAGQGITKSEVA